MIDAAQILLGLWRCHDEPQPPTNRKDGGRDAAETSGRRNPAATATGLLPAWEVDETERAAGARRDIEAGDHGAADCTRRHLRGDPDWRN